MSDIATAVQRHSGAVLSSLRHTKTFADHSVWDLCDVVDKQGAKPWHAIDMDTGEVTSGIAYEHGISWLYDFVLFFVADGGASVVLVSPEAGVGIELAMRNDDSLTRGISGSSIQAYHSALNFAKLGERDAPWSALVNELKSLPSEGQA